MGTIQEPNYAITEPNPSISSSMSDSSNGSGAVVVGSSSTSMEQDPNQTFRTHKNSSERGGGSLLTVKATYGDDSIDFKLDPYAVDCCEL
ncbi:hypothetical protein Bca4012_021788 [Brassica carinata]